MTLVTWPDPRLIDPWRMRVLRPATWAGRLNKIMARKKWHSPEQIVGKLTAAVNRPGESGDFVI